MPSDFRRHMSPAAYSMDVLSATDNTGRDPDASALESDCHEAKAPSPMRISGTAHSGIQAVQGLGS